MPVFLSAGDRRSGRSCRLGMSARLEAAPQAGRAPLGLPLQQAEHGCIQLAPLLTLLKQAKVPDLGGDGGAVELHRGTLGHALARCPPRPAQAGPRADGAAGCRTWFAGAVGARRTLMAGLAAII